MALRTFGGGPADVTSDANGDVVSGVSLQVYTAVTGGQRVTELYDRNGTPLPAVVMSSSEADMLGRITFQADSQYDVLFLDPGYGMRWAIGAQDAFSAASTALSRATDALAIASQTVTETALNSRVDSVKTEMHDWVQGAGTPITHLDRARVVCAFPAEKVGDETYVAPQGFSVDKAENRLYVSYGSGPDTTQRFEVRDLTTGERLSHRVLTADAQSYSESLPWFKNGSDQLCFIVWLKASASLPTTYRIYNYDTGVLSSEVQINGKVRGDYFGNLFVTSDAYGSTGSKFWVYSWESIKAGNPQLLQTIPMSNPGATPAKVQGQTTVGSHFLIYGGDPAQDPTVTVYNNLGQVESVRRWSRADIARIIAETSPYQITNPAFAWEGEGITNHAGRIYTGHYVSDLNIPATSATKQIVILEHGDPITPAMTAQSVTGYQPTTAWADIPVASGIVADLPFQYRVEGEKIEIKGRVKPSSGSFATTSSGITVGTLPVTPTNGQIFTASAGGTTTPIWSRIVMNTNGTIVAYPSAATNYIDMGSVGPVYLS